MLDLDKADDYPKWLIVFWALVQAGVAVAIGRFVIGRDFVLSDFITLGFPIVASLLVTYAVGVPFWRNENFGDGFDISLLVFGAACFSAGHTHHKSELDDVKKAILFVAENPNEIVDLKYLTSDGKRVIVTVTTRYDDVRFY